jgi:hypothetical protein
MARKHSNCCKTCGLLFTEENLHLFPVEKHVTKKGIKSHYRSSRCKKCTSRRGVTFIDDNREYIKTLKENASCKDCGNKYPHYVMQFDHLKDKRFNIGSRTSVSRLTLLTEIEKCEIVCANCHAKRTYERRNSK